MSVDRLQQGLDTVTRALLAERTAEGHWVGELSASALSTATAVIALATVDRQQHAPLIEGGLGWLSANANRDGGWGDTIRSRSNLSTTALVWAALGTAQADARFPDAVAQAQQWIVDRAGSLDELVPAVEAAYGVDRTFSVPITMTLALSGRLGESGWARVRPLPFEIAVLPAGLFGALRLPVVSYALPALIAIGQVIHHHAPTTSPVQRWIREAARNRTLQRLSRLQPVNGGFLEATPLTSFVVMSLAAMGQMDHEVARRGAAFLVGSVRPDGSWPIDTHLATWVTTLAIKALAQQPEVFRSLDAATLRSWLLDQQFRAIHPYTQAAPGGWAWTPLPGGVPDADDTAGALIALRLLAGPKPDADSIRAAAAGATWLLGLQNSDGGIPTFCRGWGKLPFDRSTPELTAHALRAWAAWSRDLEPSLQRRLQAAVPRAYAFLTQAQRADGAWLPLWFGNEGAPQQANPVYGTAQVLIALLPNRDPLPEDLQSAARAGTQYLVEAQNVDGGWGGAPGVPSTVEETAVALQALVAEPMMSEEVQRGLDWLLTAIEQGRHRQPAAVGLYFARLWYYERLYPLILSAGALGAARETQGAG